MKPSYRQFCKRPCFNDEYLETFNLPGVSLIDTQGKGIDRITEKGIVANGVEYELDCIVFATGFEVGTEYTRRSGYDVIGREGQSLKDKWQDGVRSLHGIHTNGFPNCFIIHTSQAGFTVNFPHAMNEQAKQIAYIAEASKVKLMWGCNDESVVSIAAALHLALSSRSTKFLDLDGSLDLIKDVVTGGFLIKNGMMTLTGKNGLGVQKVS